VQLVEQVEQAVTVLVVLELLPSAAEEMVLRVHRLLQQ
jgi:hypothetical protein